MPEESGDFYIVIDGQIVGTARRLDESTYLETYPKEIQTIFCS